MKSYETLVRLERWKNMQKWHVIYVKKGACPPGKVKKHAKVTRNLCKKRDVIFVHVNEYFDTKVKWRITLQYTKFFLHEMDLLCNLIRLETRFLSDICGKYYFVSSDFTVFVLAGFENDF